MLNNCELEDGMNFYGMWRVLKKSEKSSFVKKQSNEFIGRKEPRKPLDFREDLQISCTPPST